MAFGLSSAMVAEFAARPFIQAALAQQPRINPTGVMSFFLGVDYSKPEQAAVELESGEFIDKMQSFWFAGHADYDSLCQTNFKTLIREVAAGTPESPLGTEWTDTVNGQMAQLILFDQLSRNVFRGSEEAFAYDDKGLDVAKNLVQEFVFSHDEDCTLQGTFYPTYAIFPVTCLMHSEDPTDHEMFLKVIDWAQERTNLDDWWKGQRAFGLDHTRVLDEFGRYPHRNIKKGRESTPKELEWLANTDELPGWAASQ